MNRTVIINILLTQTYITYICEDIACLIADFVPVTFTDNILCSERSYLPEDILEVFRSAYLMKHWTHINLTKKINKLLLLYSNNEIFPRISGALIYLKHFGPQHTGSTDLSVNKKRKFIKEQHCKILRVIDPVLYDKRIRIPPNFIEIIEVIDENSVGFSRCMKTSSFWFCREINAKGKDVIKLTCANSEVRILCLSSNSIYKCMISKPTKWIIEYFHQCWDYSFVYRGTIVIHTDFIGKNSHKK